MGRKCATSDLHVVAADIYTFVTAWHQAWYFGVKEIGVKCLLLGVDTLLNVGVCCNLLADQVLQSGSKETEITGPGFRTFGRVIHNLAAVVP